MGRSLGQFLRAGAPRGHALASILAVLLTVPPKPFDEATQAGFNLSFWVVAQ